MGGGAGVTAIIVALSALIGSVVTKLFDYLLGKRAASGNVDTSAAGETFKAATELRADMAKWIEWQDTKIKEQDARLAQYEAEVENLRVRIRELETSTLKREDYKRVVQDIKREAGKESG